MWSLPDSLATATAWVSCVHGSGKSETDVISIKKKKTKTGRWMNESEFSGPWGGGVMMAGRELFLSAFPTQVSAQYSFSPIGVTKQRLPDQHTEILMCHTTYRLDMTR